MMGSLPQEKRQSEQYLVSVPGCQVRLSGEAVREAAHSRAQKKSTAGPMILGIAVALQRGDGTNGDYCV